MSSVISQSASKHFGMSNVANSNDTANDMNVYDTYMLYNAYNFNHIELLFS